MLTKILPYNIDGAGASNGQVLTSNGSVVSWSNVSSGGGSSTIVVDSFVGNGSANAYTLSTSPASDAYVFAYLNGVLQHDSTYSVSGSTITFDDNVSNGANVEVRSITSIALANAVPLTGGNITGNLSVNGNTTLNGVIANGSVGTAGQALTSNGSIVYWSTMPVANIGLIANATGWFVAANSGLVANATGVFVAANNGIVANSTGVFVNANSGLASNTSGLFVAANNGIVANATGVFVNANSGLVVNATGVFVNPNSGIVANATGVFVAANDGIIANATGVFVNANNGLVANTNGLFVNAKDGLVSNSSGLFAIIPGANTQIYFNDSGVANATGGYTFDKTTNNVYVANSLGINITSPTAKIDISGTAVHNIVALGNTSAMDLASGQIFSKTITVANTFTFSNVPTSRAMTAILHLTNGANSTITWPTSIKWPGGTAPTLTANGVDVLVFNTIDGGTNWRGNIFGKDIK